MKRARIGIIGVAALAVATVAFAQKPDFSGTWTLDPEASQMGAPGGGRMGGAPGGRGGGMMGGPMTVTQTADTLTIERAMGDMKTTAVYKLDGTESVNKQTMGQMGEIEIRATARWDGNKLAITEKRPGRDGAIQETTQTWSLDGGNLVVERTGGRGATKQVYKKG